MAARVEFENQRTESLVKTLVHIGLSCSKKSRVGLPMLEVSEEAGRSGDVCGKGSTGYQCQRPLPVCWLSILQACPEPSTVIDDSTWPTLLTIAWTIDLAWRLSALAGQAVAWRDAPAFRGTLRGVVAAPVGAAITVNWIAESKPVPGSSSCVGEEG